jgi:hypothetical protein
VQLGSGPGLVSPGTSRCSLSGDLYLYRKRSNRVAKPEGSYRFNRAGFSSGHGRETRPQNCHLLQSAAIIASGMD